MDKVASLLMANEPLQHLLVCARLLPLPCDRTIITHIQAHPQFESEMSLKSVSRLTSYVLDGWIYVDFYLSFSAQLLVTGVQLMTLR